jgi:hypothetical protein
MKTINQAVEELERLVESKLPRYDIPYKQGKSIRIGKTIVRRSQRHGYVIIDIEDNAMITNAFCKHGAIAIAKAYNQGKNYDMFAQFDKKVEKHYNDSIFYTYNIMNSKDEQKKQMLEHRLEISQDEISYAYDTLEKFILTIER